MYPTAYIQYLVHFHGDRDYFECHEVLEEYWKTLKNEDKQSIWVGLILLAVSNYHFRRQNYNGAQRTLTKAISIFQDDDRSRYALGLDMDKLMILLKQRLKDIQANRAYQSFNLPITDSKLLTLCLKACKDTGLDWGQESNLQNMNLIDRHKLRDRTDVISERQRSLAKRKQKESREAD